MNKDNIVYILRYLSFATLIIASLVIIFKFNINYQANYFQFIFFLIMFSNIINLARKNKIIIDIEMLMAYILCIIYSIFIVFFLYN
ncbi:hypothetical protein C815_02025 [Firmicutes bacterium M10-2]|nr:hypothetical protein C815_02025 [Firmicutes bacterium M10-2]